MKEIISDIDFKMQWDEVINYLFKLTGKKPDLNAVLYLIGIQELGLGVRQFGKEEKQDLMHIATCRLLSNLGYYKLEGLDEEGWPHWEVDTPIPKLELNDQEKLIKIQAIEYFKPFII